VKFISSILEALLVVLQIIVCIPLLIIMALVSVAIIAAAIAFGLFLVIVAAPFVLIGMGYDYIKERVKGRR